MSGVTDRPQTLGVGDLFRQPANRPGLGFKNASGSEPAKLLLYQVSEKLRQ
jgi:hypothetical protein